MVETHILPAGEIVLSVRTSPCASPMHPAVALLPGTGATARDWDTVAADLSRDRVVHAVDLRGHGASDWPGRYGITLMAEDIAVALPRLASCVDVVGHSLGGLVACIVAAGDGPVRRLVLEDVGVPHPREPKAVPRPDGVLDFDWAVVEQVRPEIDDPDPTWPQTLARITAPTLVVSGGPSSFVPVEHTHELADLVGEGTWTSIDTGHLVHATEPRLFLDAVRGHLDA